MVDGGVQGSDAPRVESFAPPVGGAHIMRGEETYLSPRRNREPELEQGDVDRQPRKRSRGPLDERWESGRDVLARDEPVVERSGGRPSGEDRVAPLRRLEHQDLAAR